MPSDVQIRGAAGSAPQEYVVPNATEIIPKVVAATFNGAAAGQAFWPALEVISDGGVRVSLVLADELVSTGGSGNVTWAPFLESLRTSTGGGADLTNTIIAAGANALWKMDETSGTVAHDATGNGWDAASATLTPAWGSDAGPPGTSSAAWPGDWRYGFANGAYPALGSGGAAFSVFGWMRWHETDSGHSNILVGQGSTSVVAFGTGWSIAVTGTSELNPHKLVLRTNNGTFAGVERIYSDNTLTQDQWYFIAVTWDGTRWRLYVDGFVQTSTDTRAWSPVAGISLGTLQTNVSGGAFALSGMEEWWASVPGVALTSTQFLAIMASVP